jgi:hypothetical protein
MTTVLKVSQKQMEQRTGFKYAMGYALPDENTILIRNDLSPSKRKEVLAHEEDHIRKGEEGPFLNFIIPAVASLAGGLFSSRSAKKATQAQTDASNREIEFARESRDLARSDQAPYREAGYTALDALMSLTGLAGPRSSEPARTEGVRPRGIVATDYLRGFRGRYSGGPVYPRNQFYNINEMGPESRYEGGSYTRNPRPQTISPSGAGYIHPRVNGGFTDKITPQFPPVKDPSIPSTIDNDTGEVEENPGGVEGGYNFKTDPGYEFRLGEGQRVLERGASAAGGLLSGGYARRAIRYGQDYASNEYNNVYNRIANIAGLGQVSAGQSGNAALYAGAQMGSAASSAGAARASGYTAQGNAWSTAINEIGKLPWEDIFKKDKGQVGPPY